MKKIFKFIIMFTFLLTILFSLFACKDDNDNEDKEEKELGEMTATEEANHYGLEAGTYYRITFTNEEKTLLVGIVKQGTNDLYVNGVKTEFPIVDAREGYFGKWKYTSLNNIKKDIENSYKWTINTYTIVFMNHGKELDKATYDYGTVLTEDDLPDLELEYGNKVSYWDIELPYIIKKNDIINAVHEQIEFAIQDNNEFDKYLDELFYDELGDDPLSINFNLYHPENFYKEGVFDFNDCIFEGYTFSIEDEEEYYDYLREVITKLNSYKDTEISESQYLDKIVLLDYYNKSLAYEGFFYYGTLLGSYLGYQAQLPTTLAEYRLDNEKCIDDYLSYIKNTQNIFEEIVKFEKEKIDLGMPLTDEIINRVIEQCDEFINADSENPNFLIPVMNAKIDKCEFLTEAKKAEYKEKNTKFVSEYFLSAYTYLRNELNNMLGSENSVKLENNQEYTGAFSQFENGKEYYEAKIQDALGTTMTVDEIYNYLKKLLTKNMGIYRDNQDIVNEVSNSNVMTKKELTIDDLIPFFIDAIKDDFPSLDVSLVYSISNIDKSLQENSSPAMYFISPIDDNLTESIYVNPSNKDLAYPSTYMYSTIAHEGYPGHLYQNVYMKNLDYLPNVRKLISYSSYAEGWATHVENYVYKYVLDDSYYEVMLAYDSLTYIIIGMADIGINYYGWSIDETHTFISKYFNMSKEEVTDLYYDMTEIPTNYLMYFFSANKMEDMRLDLENALGDDYSDLIFHTIVLNAGSVSFDVLEYLINDYIEDYKNK